VIDAMHRMFTGDVRDAEARYEKHEKSGLGQPLAYDYAIAAVTVTHAVAAVAARRT
jgi:hypothetical protein